MKVGYCTIQHIVDNQLVKEFVFFMKIKSLNTNSVVYKSSLKFLPQYLQCSRSKVDRMLFIFKKEGWVSVSKNGHIKFLSGKEIEQIYKKTIPFFFKYFKAETEDDINLEILNNKIKQRSYIDNKISYQKQIAKKKFISKKEYKFLNRTPDVRYFYDNVNQFSLMTLAKFFNCSKSKIFNILKRLELLGKIKIERQFKILSEFKDKESLIYFHSIYNYSYINKNSILIKRPSLITLVKDII